MEISSINCQSVDNRYLMKQNSRLRFEIKELRQVIEIQNKVIASLNGPNTQKNVVINSLIEIIKNNPDSKKVQRLKQQVLQLENKVLNLKKIVDMANDYQEQKYNLFLGYLIQLKQENMYKDEQLQKYHKNISELDFKLKFTTKNISIISPSEQAIAFKQQQNKLLYMQMLQKQNIDKLKIQKQELLTINLSLKEELDRRRQDILKITMILQNPQGSPIFCNPKFTEETLQQKVQSIPLQSNFDNGPKRQRTSNFRRKKQMNKAINFIKLQKELLKREEDSEGSDDEYLESFELALLFPDKVKNMIQSKNKNKVPTLSLGKAYEVQELQDLKNYYYRVKFQSPESQIQQLQKQSQFRRKELSSIMLKYHSLEQQNKKLTQTAKQLQNRNQVLIAANQRINLVHRQLFREYQWCKNVMKQFQLALGINLKEDNIEDFIQKLQNRQKLQTLGHQKSQIYSIVEIFLNKLNRKQKRRLSI